MAEPAIAKQPKKRLAIFLDGTFNAVDDNTNVWRLKSVCAPKSEDGSDQFVYYARGVNGFWGGTVGKGLDELIKGGYEWLIDQYETGDEVFIFGFSRGAYPSDLLAQIPLRWMMKKASSQGLAFKNDIDLDGDALMAGISDSYREFMYGAYSKFSRRYYRPIGETPREDDDGTHTNVNETIDASVFDRYRADTGYRPPNMVEWAKRYQVAPAELRSSVRANEPKTDVPD